MGSLCWEVMVDCPSCSASNADGARFCARCGTSLHGGIDRKHYFAAMPDEPVRATAVMSTLMPHLSGARLYVYRDVIGLALLASLIAAAFGVLSVALIFAAVALPAAVLTYIYDHGVWRGDPVTTIGLGFVLALALGVGVGLLQRYFATGPVLLAPWGRFPSPTTILQLGVIVPAVVYVALLVVPVIVTARPRMRNAVDTVVICTLSAAMLSLGMSVVVQWGAFTGVKYGDPPLVAFIAVNLGLVQPIIFGTAAAVSVLALRRPGSSTVLGVAKGLVLVLVYELGTTLLTPHASKGVVLTTVLGVIVAAAGVRLARAEIHAALLAEAQAALSGDKKLVHAPDADRVCGHCGAAISAGAAFCQACGTATAALGRPSGKAAAAKRSA